MHTFLKIAVFGADTNLIEIKRKNSITLVGLWISSFKCVYMCVHVRELEEGVLDRKRERKMIHCSFYISYIIICDSTAV